MKIFPISINSSKGISLKKAPAFSGEDVKEPQQTTSAIGVTNPVDYNTTTPMAYKFIKDISLPNGLNAKYYKLANGQKVVIIPKDGATVVKTYVNTGSLNEPDNLRGISHYIEHNLFNGSKALNNEVFFDEVNKMGANTNASTSFSVTDYYISSNLLDENDLENKIRLHAGMLETPKFDEDKLAKEKEIVNSEINMCLSDDISRAETLTIKNLFNIDTKSLDLVAGTTDNIDNLKREDVVDYFEKNYTPDNMVTVITGEVKPEETMKLVSKYFKSQKVQKPHTRIQDKMTLISQPVRNDLVSDKNKTNAHFVMGFASPENGDLKEKLKYQAAVNYMFFMSNSKIEEMAEKYSAHIENSSERLGRRKDDKGANLIHCTSSDNSVEPIMKELYNIITQTANKPISEDELTALKNKMKMGIHEYFECSHAINSFVGSMFLNGTQDDLPKYEKMIENLTPQDVMEGAKKYFDLNRVAITVVHPKGVSQDTIKSNYTKAANISFTGSNKKTPINMDKVTEYRAANNFTIVLNDADTDVVSCDIEIRKPNDPNQNSAVSDILGKILRNGTKTKTANEVSAIQDKYSIISDITSGANTIRLSAEFDYKNADKAMELFKENITEPNFSESAVNKAIVQKMDKYQQVEPNAYSAFFKLAAKNTPLEHSAQDKMKTAASLKPNDVEDFYKKIMSQGQAKIVITAPISKHPELKDIIFKNISSYGTFKSKDNTLESLYTPVEKTQVVTTENHKNQATIVEGFKFKQNGNLKDDVCIHLMNQILGGSPSSRLFSDLREARHLCYSVSSGYINLEDMGILLLNIGTTTNNAETGVNTYDNIQKSIEGFNENIKRIMSEKVSAEELETAKKAMKTDILESLETHSDKNSSINSGISSLYGADYVNKKLEMIDSITQDDILNTAKYIFSNKPIYSVAGTKEALNANEEFLNNLKQ